MIYLRLAFVVAAVAGCSAPTPRAVAPPIPIQSIANTQAPQSGSDLKAPQFCHLGRDCLELDSRPFTSCLVHGEPCEGEGVLMQVAPRVVFKSIQPGHPGTLPSQPSKK